MTLCTLIVKSIPWVLLSCFSYDLIYIWLILLVIVFLTVKQTILPLCPGNCSLNLSLIFVNVMIIVLIKEILTVQILTLILNLFWILSLTLDKYFPIIVFQIIPILYCFTATMQSLIMFLSIIFNLLNIRGYHRGSTKFYSLSVCLPLCCWSILEIFYFYFS